MNFWFSGRFQFWHGSIHPVDEKQSWSWSASFIRSQLIWIYTNFRIEFRSKIVKHSALVRISYTFLEDYLETAIIALKQHTRTHNVNRCQFVWNQTTHNVAALTTHVDGQDKTSLFAHCIYISSGSYWAGTICPLLHAFQSWAFPILLILRLVFFHQKINKCLFLKSFIC